MTGWLAGFGSSIAGWVSAYTCDVGGNGLVLFSPLSGSQRFFHPTNASRFIFLLSVPLRKSHGPFLVLLAFSCLSIENSRERALSDMMWPDHAFEHWLQLKPSCLRRP